MLHNLYLVLQCLNVIIMFTPSGQNVLFMKMRSLAYYKICYSRTFYLEPEKTDFQSIA